MQNYSPLFLIALCAYANTPPTHTYTDAHTRTHRSTVRAVTKEYCCCCCCIVADTIQGRTIRLVLLYGGREGVVNGKMREGNGLLQNNLVFSSAFWT